MRRRRGASLAANPVLVGAVTTLVTITAVFLAYNANQGLPFVPTFELNASVPNASRLVVGNDVREGGERIGQVTKIEPVERDGRTVAQITMSLDRSVTPLPADTSIIVRPRSTLGLKYIDLVRGSGTRELRQGASIAATEASLPPELDDLFNMFDEPTREASRVNLETFGDGLAGRGEGLNRTFAALPELLTDLVPVMELLSAESTGLRTFFSELGDAARITAPVAGELAEGFERGADVFEAFSRDPEALKATISESPPTLRAGIEEFPQQRPFLRRLAGLSDELAGTAREIRAGAAPIRGALRAGTRVLPRTPAFNERLSDSLDALREIASAPTSLLSLRGLEATADTIGPTLRYIGPQITVCNYWNYWWTLLADHISEEESTGTLQRIQVKNAAGGLNQFGAERPVSERTNNPVIAAESGAPVRLHAQPYGRAVDEQGNADCESGQRGYPLRLAQGAPSDLAIAVDPRTPGNQGPTFTGLAKVPLEQTFSAEPAGRAEPFFKGKTIR
jgi:ABC-type transporter Mla subunit MlaD